MITQVCMYVNHLTSCKHPWLCPGISLLELGQADQSIRVLVVEQAETLSDML